MPKGFIYIMASVSKIYSQRCFFNVPTELSERLYFGACKKGIRRKMKVGDYIFGISGSSPKPRKIVYITQVEEKITFKEAYEKFPSLRGAVGTIHVKPVNRIGYPFPECKYEHIKGAMHKDNWKRDIATPILDSFFVGVQGKRWLGKFGININNKILNFLKGCSIYNKTNRLSNNNVNATADYPIMYKNLYTGLHLETNEPQKLEELCNFYLLSNPPKYDEIESPKKQLPKIINKKQKKEKPNNQNKLMGYFLK